MTEVEATPVETPVETPVVEEVGAEEVKPTETTTTDETPAEESAQVIRLLLYGLRILAIFQKF